MNETTPIVKKGANDDSQNPILQDPLRTLAKQIGLPESIYPISEKEGGKALLFPVVAIGLSAAAGWVWWQETGVVLALLADAGVGYLAYRANKIAAENRELKWFNQAKFIIPVFSMHPNDSTVDQRAHYAEEMIKLSKNPFQPVVMKWIYNDFHHWGQSFENFRVRVYEEYVTENRKWLEYLSNNWKENDPETSRKIYKEKILGQAPVQPIKRSHWAQRLAKLK